MTTTSSQVDALRQALPAPAKDLRINLQNVLASESLSASQAYGVALSAAYFLKAHSARDALLADVRANELPEEVIEDAQAAASLMAMTTVFYRFRHMIGKESYGQLPARLRMQRLGKPATNKADFELFSLACAALAGCEVCIQTHEASLIKAGFSEQQIHDAIRIAATLSGAATAATLES